MTGLDLENLANGLREQGYYTFQGLLDRVAAELSRLQQVEKRYQYLRSRNTEEFKALFYHPDGQSISGYGAVVDREILSWEQSGHGNLLK
jgi:hypothetical protein